MKRAPLFALPLMLAACSAPCVQVEVANTSGEVLGKRTVEIALRDMPELRGASHFYVTDDSGREIPSQLTSDSLIVFTAEVGPAAARTFAIHPCDTARTYTSTVYGRLYPERRDDVAYENNIAGFRIYGPGTGEAGEKAFGYDLFLKYPSDEIIVPGLYEPETDPAVWARVDSLRAVDAALADAYIRSFSYHVDHGKGFDPFPVGPTLGAGAAALFDAGTILYPQYYRTARILDNGPLRFTVALDFGPDAQGRAEHRVISLDADSYLNDCKVWFDGISGPQQIVAGFPLRDDSVPYASAATGTIAYTSPVSEQSCPPVRLGICAPQGFDSVLVADSHILGLSTVAPGAAFHYKWGFAWDKSEIRGREEWLDYLRSQHLNYTVSIK